MLIINKIKDLILRPFIDVIYPPICYLCNKQLQDSSLCICFECWDKFKKFDTNSDLYQILLKRFNNEGFINGFVSLYLFEKDGKFQEVIHLLKYNNIKSIGIELGTILGKVIQKEFENIDIVTSVPLHRLKKRERGYNQVDFICKGISKVTGVNFFDNLILRVRYTQSQTKLNFQERMDNVKDAFIANKKFIDIIRGKNIIMVDDVITTGATINSAAKALKEAGASKIYAASAGVADRLE